MARRSRRMEQNQRLVAVVVSLLAFVSRSDGLAISYCSPDLTSGSFPGVYNFYQSNGACQTQCQGSYVYAVLQGYYCWCSNYIPSDQQSTYDCDQACPGDGLEWCGSTSAGLYGYYYLGGTPLGTLGGSSAAPSTTQPVSTTSSTPGSTPPVFPPPVVSSSSFLSSPSASTASSVPTTPASKASIVSVVTVVPPQSAVQTSITTVPSSSTVPVSAASTSSTTSSTAVLSTSSSTPSTTQPPSSTQTDPSSMSPSTIVTTVTGIVKTILVTPTATPDATLGQSTSNGGGLSTGSVVGIVLGVALGLGSIIGLGVFFWLRRKHENSLRGLSPDGSSYRETSSDRNRVIPSRQVSQLSSSNLLTRGGSVQAKSLGPSITTRSAETASSGIDRRSMGTDQRLNPNALYIHDEGQASSLSLQDNYDYSRQLRVANPDP